MPSLPVTLLCQYHYDALDRLIANASANAPEQQCFYCESQLTTVITAAAHSSIVQHLNQLLAQQRDDGNTRDTTLLATDRQRSVLQTLKANHPRHSIAYSPYGHRPGASGLLSLLGFNGERADPVTGYYFLGNGHRVFNPALMRFISPDRWSPFGRGGINPYAYCLGDPVNRSDPNGKYSKLLIEATRISGKVTRNGKLYRYSNLSPEEALKTNDKIIKLDKKILKKDPMQAKFRKDFPKSSTNTILSSKEASSPSTTNNFPDDQTNLFNYINSGDASRPILNESALISAASQTDTHVVLTTPRINKNLAKEYLGQMNRIATLK
jgi:RHS repeat-associated protein